MGTIRGRISAMLGMFGCSDFIRLVHRRDRESTYTAQGQKSCCPFAKANYVSLLSAQKPMPMEISDVYMYWVVACRVARGSYAGALADLH